MTDAFGAAAGSRPVYCFDSVRNSSTQARDEAYPPIAATLSELMHRIDANDREIAHINGSRLPDGAQRILVAELVARGLEGFVKNGVQTPSLLQELRLPAFIFDQHAPYAWSGVPARPPVLRLEVPDDRGKKAS